MLPLILLTSSAQALTIGGKAPEGAKTVTLAVDVTAKRKIPILCTEHLGGGPPILDGGTEPGWYPKRRYIEVKVPVSEDGNYEVKIDFKRKLTKSICKYRITDLQIRAHAPDGPGDDNDKGDILLVNLIPDKSASQTDFDFEFKGIENFKMSARADVNWNSVFEVNIHR